MQFGGLIVKHSYFRILLVTVFVVFVSPEERMDIMLETLNTLIGVHKLTVPVVFVRACRHMNRKYMYRVPVREISSTVGTLVNKTYTSREDERT